MAKKKQITWAEGLTMFNTPIGTNSEFAEDMMFNIQTDIIVNIANSAIHKVVEGTDTDNKEMLQLGTDALTDLVKTFREAVEENVFRKEDVEAMAVVVAEFLADPMKFVADNE
jgi:diacylglycerol kinase